MLTSASIERWLSLTWWLLFPAFSTLVVWTVYERACVGLREPWPWLAGRPTAAFLVGCVYVAAHWWCVVWVVLHQRRSERNQTTTAASLARASSGSTLRMAALAAALVVDYSPMTLLRWISQEWCC